METLAYLAWALLALLAVGLVYVVVISQTVLKTLTRQERLIEFIAQRCGFGPSGGGTHMFGDPDYGFCIWVFRDGKWSLSDDFSREGSEPGPPPRHPGSYEGEAVRKPSVKKA
jgi:hypothetical protein